MHQVGRETGGAIHCSRKAVTGVFTHFNPDGIFISWSTIVVFRMVSLLCSR